MIMPTSQSESEAPAPYDFDGPSTAAFPTRVMVEPTEVCDLACIHCPHPHFKRSPQYHGLALDPELNAKLVDEVRLQGQGCLQQLRYGGNGEPLTHPRLFDMLDYASQQAGSGVTITLATNGRLLTPEHTERLLASRIQIVDISLDAFSPATYARIRVGGDLNVTRQNVLHLIEHARAAGATLQIVVSYVEQILNHLETADFEAFWHDAGADHIVVRRLQSCSGAKRELARQRRHLNAQQPRRPCLYPWQSIVLNAIGHLAFCPTDWARRSVLADYRTTTIHDLWQGTHYQSLRRAHLDDDYADHPFCGQCPDWVATNWPHLSPTHTALPLPTNSRPACLPTAQRNDLPPAPSPLCPCPAGHRRSDPESRPTGGSLSFTHTTS
ncbi:MAG: radical SAM protein [Verrucomicrobia bacterium]|nr:radical SAM protein [Verrucomicrobiota bacterium]